MNVIIIVFRDKNINYLEALRYSNKFDKYINELLDKCKDTIILEKSILF